MSAMRLSATERAAVASGAAAVALQLAEDLTFPMRDRATWERTRRELRDGFLTVVAEVFPDDEAGRPATVMAGAHDQDPGRP